MGLVGPGFVAPGHWCDVEERTSGKRIQSVLAALTTIFKTRYVTGTSAEAFVSEHTGKATPVEVLGKDLGSILLRFENNARGALSVGQVLPGHKNDLIFEINGQNASLRWSQESQNELWVGSRDQPNQVMIKDPPVMIPCVHSYAHLPAGHQEGCADAFQNVIADIYRWIRAGTECRPDEGTTCSIAEATHTLHVVVAILRSHSLWDAWQAVYEQETKQ